MAVDFEQIAALLIQSRSAHEQYRHFTPRMAETTPGQVSVFYGVVAQANSFLVLALRLRTEAHALDPKREAPAWRGEPVTHDHDALLDFYVGQLSR